MNGDVIRAGPADLGSGPYLARLFGRYLIPLSGQMGEPGKRNMDQLPGAEPADRIEIKAGKLSAADDFDLNGYANNQRSQFPITPFFTIRHGTTRPTRGAIPSAPPLRSFIPPGDNLRQLPGADDEQRLHSRQPDLPCPGGQSGAHHETYRSRDRHPTACLPQRGAHGRLPGRDGHRRCRQTAYPASRPTSSRDARNTASASTSSSPSQTTARQASSRGLGWANGANFDLVVCRGRPHRVDRPPGERRQLGTQR